MTPETVLELLSSDFPIMECVNASVLFLQSATDSILQDSGVAQTADLKQQLRNLMETFTRLLNEHLPTIAKQLCGSVKDQFILHVVPSLPTDDDVIKPTANTHYLVLPNAQKKSGWQLYFADSDRAYTKKPIDKITQLKTLLNSIDNDYPIGSDKFNSAFDNIVKKITHRFELTFNAAFLPCGFMVYFLDQIEKRMRHELTPDSMTTFLMHLGKRNSNLASSTPAVEAMQSLVQINRKGNNKLDKIVVGALIVAAKNYLETSAFMITDFNTHYQPKKLIKLERDQLASVQFRLFVTPKKEAAILENSFTARTLSA